MEAWREVSRWWRSLSGAIRLCTGDAEGRIVPRDEVERCFRAAIGCPEAAEMKQNSLKWKKAAEEAVVEGGSSYRNMRDFVDEVVRIRVTDHENIHLVICLLTVVLSNSRLLL
ncbi:UNVERIFIED_CONTAM: Cinnamate beta-D-glucosyltransferase [Sesamum angustifolium]|uniref:Cinnamate beta-D-glucosyltransferase n=1 Tax=Sesamum angustifolium TaxID=2727405 RepID=A0AAW2QCL6_9LAMI